MSGRTCKDSANSEEIEDAARYLQRRTRNVPGGKCGGLSKTSWCPKIESWNRDGRKRSRKLRKMGEAGFLGANAPAEYGGAGADFLYDAIVVEELSRVRATD